MPDFAKRTNLPSDASIESIIFGSNAKMLEVELNELQRVEHQRLINLYNTLFKGGLIYSTGVDIYGDRIEINNGIFNVGGRLVKAEPLLTITFPAKPASGTKTYKIIMETWDEQTSYADYLYKYGKHGGTVLTNHIKDSRLDLETTMRLQQLYRVRIVEANAVTSIHPFASLVSEASELYTAVTNKENQYIASLASPGKIENGVVYCTCLYTLVLTTSTATPTKEGSGTYIKTSDLITDALNRLVTDSQINSWTKKAEVAYADNLVQRALTQAMPTITTHAYSYVALQGQIDFLIGLSSFSPITDTVFVFKNSVFNASDDYIVVNVSGQYYVRFNTPLNVDSVVNIVVLNNAPMDDLNEYCSGLDANGKYTVKEFKRQDSTLAYKYILSNIDANGNYRTITLQYYDSTGTSVTLTKIWTLTFDANGNVLSKVRS